MADMHFFFTPHFNFITNMAGNSLNFKHFTIEDCFDDHNDDSIRVYGSTTERSPLNCGHLSGESASDQSRVFIQEPFNKLTVSREDAVSRDSDSLVRRTDSSENDFDPSQSCWKHPKIKDNWKIVLAAIALLLVGIGLFVIGVGLTVAMSFTQGLVFYIAGIICFIPGVYHIVYIYLAVKGRRGYYFYHLPLFN